MSLAGPLAVFSRSSYETVLSPALKTEFRELSLSVLTRIHSFAFDEWGWGCYQPKGIVYEGPLCYQYSFANIIGTLESQKKLKSLFIGEVLGDAQHTKSFWDDHLMWDWGCASNNSDSCGYCRMSIAGENTQLLTENKKVVYMCHFQGGKSRVWRYRQIGSTGSSKYLHTLPQFLNVTATYKNGIYV